MTDIEHIGEILITAVGNLAAVVEYLSRTGFQGAGQQSQQGCFTTAIGAFNLHYLAAVKAQINIFKQTVVVALEGETLNF